MSTPKAAALSARPDVALAIDAGGTPEHSRALSVRGRSAIPIVDGVVEQYLTAALKNVNAEGAAQFVQNCREMRDRMARITITPRWARRHSFGAGRMPMFLQQLAARSRR